MSRFRFIKTTAAILSIAATCSFAQAGEIRVGRMPQREFEKFNKASDSKIGEIEVTSQRLSDSDEALLKELAALSMVQFDASKLAASKSSNPGVKALAEAEVAEELILAGKLKEIAGAKGAKVSFSSDERSRKVIAELERKSGAEFDAAYLWLCGVQGHQSLQSVMIRIKASSGDENLQDLSKIARPMIELHMNLAKDEAGKLEKATLLGAR